MKAKNFQPLAIIAASMALAALSACSQQTAVEKGKALATEKIDMAKGVGDALQEKGAATGESVVGGVGTVIKGMEKGMLKSGRTISADPTLAAAGLKITKIQDAASGADGKTHGLDAYIVADAAARGTLRVFAFDALDNEIGRASVRIVHAADEGKYHIIALDPQVNLVAISRVAFAFKPGGSAQKK